MSTVIYHRSTTAAALLLASVASAPASAQGIDQSFYYKLSTQFRGSGMKLDVLNGGPKNNMTRLEPDQDVSGQFWRFVENPDGTFRISSLFRGLGMCLDIFNGGANNNQSHLTGCGNFIGPILERRTGGTGRACPPDNQVPRPWHMPG
jgi:Ricin-type beta-trefoil lectin domain-like